MVKISNYNFLCFTKKNNSKLVNVIVPETIPAGQINCRNNLNQFEKMENLTKALQNASSIGIKIVAIGPEDFTKGKTKAHLILGVLWQFVRMDLMNKIAAQVDANANENDNVGPEDILMNWFNKHLQEAKSDRIVNNFASDIQVFFFFLKKKIKSKNRIVYLILHYYIN